MGGGRKGAYCAIMAALFSFVPITFATPSRNQISQSMMKRRGEKWLLSPRMLCFPAVQQAQAPRGSWVGAYACYTTPSKETLSGIVWCLTLGPSVVGGGAPTRASANLTILLSCLVSVWRLSVVCQWHNSLTRAPAVMIITTGAGVMITGGMGLPLLLQLKQVPPDLSFFLVLKRCSGCACGTTTARSLQWW